MLNIALLLSYDGSPFWGWQKTAQGPTIEGELIQALETLLQEPITLQAASRTDRGVHALGQVVNFFSARQTLSLPSLHKSLNALLPPSIRILQVSHMPDSFHPTLQVYGKSYLYHICTSPYQLPMKRFFSWHIPFPLHQKEMEKAATFLTGEHDFAAFCNFRKNLNYPHTIREIKKIDLVFTADNLEITLTGNHFLYKMARNIVGTLVAVGKGKLSAADMLPILAHKQRILAGMTAPGHALFLKKVFYPQEFEKCLYLKPE